MLAQRHHFLEGFVFFADLGLGVKLVNQLFFKNGSFQTAQGFLVFFVPVDDFLRVFVGSSDGLDTGINTCLIHFQFAIVEQFVHEEAQADTVACRFVEDAGSQFAALLCVRDLPLQLHIVCHALDFHAYHAFGDGLFGVFL